MTRAGGVVLGAPIRSLPTGPQGIGTAERRQLLGIVGRAAATGGGGGGSSTPVDTTVHFGRVHVRWHAGEVTL